MLPNAIDHLPQVLVLEEITGSIGIKTGSSRERSAQKQWLGCRQQ